MNKNENQTPHWTETKVGLGILADLFEEAGLGDIPQGEANGGGLTNVQIGQLFDNPGVLALAFISLENEAPEKKRARLEEMVMKESGQKDSPQFMDEEFLSRIFPPYILNCYFKYRRD
jgi:hypothetical protein